MIVSSRFPGTFVRFLKPLKRQVSRRVPFIERRRLRPHYECISHSICDRRPVIPRAIVPDIAPTKDDEAIVARLITAYRLCKEVEAALPGQGTGSDMWSAIRRLQTSFFAMLELG